MKKYIALSCLALASCGVDYDGETRLISELQVVNSEGDPISESWVSIEVDDDNYDSETISISKSGTDGKSLLIFPAPDDSQADITINVSQNNDFPDPANYLYTSIRHIRKPDCVDYKLPISQVVLYRPDEVVNLNIEYQPTNNSYIAAMDLEGKLSGAISYGGITGELFGNSYVVAKNQQVSLHYTVYDAGSQALSDHVATISINSGDVNFIVTN